MICGNFLGRKIIPTTLDPVPPLLRCSAGVIVMNGREISAIDRRDPAVIRRLIQQVHEYDLLTLANRLNEAM